MMREFKAYNRHPAHQALFDAIAVSLKADKDSKKKKRKDHDASSSKKTKDHPTSSKGMDEEPAIDEVVNDDEHPQDHVAPSQDKSGVLKNQDFRGKEICYVFYKAKRTSYELYEIEEMIPNLWSPSKAAYDKDAAYRISHWGPKRKLFYMERQAAQSKHTVYSRMKILSIDRISVDKQFGYDYLQEIVVKRANQKEYLLKEADFPRLHL
ncbi:hypothetical protein Tco_0698073 [Tanacetum coccineum]